MSSTPDVIVFSYPFSAFGRKLDNYLALRGLKHKYCTQPVTLPRPDLASLGLSYRRIPLVAIGRDIYPDTRLIIPKLETLYPKDNLSSNLTADQRALSALLGHWTNDALGPAAALIADIPEFKDEGFIKDRTEYAGRTFHPDVLRQMRPEALVGMRAAFRVLEDVLEDGRDWLLGTEKPNLADIEASWIYDWLTIFPTANDPESVNANLYPKVFTWLSRLATAVQTATSTHGKPDQIPSGPGLTSHILSQPFAEPDCVGVVDQTDPLGLKEGDEVEIWPTDTGTKNHDRGRVVCVSVKEIVIGVVAPGGKGGSQEENEIRVHFPREKYRVVRVKAKL